MWVWSLKRWVWSPKLVQTYNVVIILPHPVQLWRVTVIHVHNGRFLQVFPLRELVVALLEAEGEGRKERGWRKEGGRRRRGKGREGRGRGGWRRERK